MTISQNETYDIEPGQSYQVDLFRPEDAEGVASLFLTVYGREYPFKVFIEPKALVEENAAGRIISSVARTEKGDIVGHNALFCSSPWEGIRESGAGLVHPHYRGGKGIYTDMGRHGIQIAAKHPEIHGYYGEAVCNHPYAQRGVAKVAKFMTLEVALVPAETYAKEKAASDRVSCLFFFGVLQPRHHTVYLPGIYEKALEAMYGSLDDTRDFHIADQDLPDQASVIESRIFDFAQVVRMTVRETGRDFGSVLDKHEKDALDKKVETLQVWLKLSPNCGAAVEELRRRGYFLGGLLPRWFNEDGLLMQKTMTAPDWDKIVIALDYCERIKDDVRADWAAVQQV